MERNEKKTKHIEKKLNKTKEVQLKEMTKNISEKSTKLN